jgi:hypothetical protein
MSATTPKPPIAPKDMNPEYLVRLAFEINGRNAVNTVSEELHNWAAELREEVLRRLLQRDQLHNLINTPQIHDFIKAVPLEASHAMNRWGETHDAEKEPPDWFWLLGYLAGKALHASITGDYDKALHHTISSAGVCANWHRHLLKQKQQLLKGLTTADNTP